LKRDSGLVEMFSKFCDKIQDVLTRPRGYAIQNALTLLLGEARFGKLKNLRAYRITVEAFTMNVFSIAITTPGEFLIAGMDFMEWLMTRLSSSVINTLTGRLYGIWRDWFLTRLKVNEKSHFFRKYLCDTLAFVGFQLPLYWISMTISGVELNEMIRASMPLVLIAGITGRPYGVWLDKFRLECGLPAMTVTTRHIS